MQIPDRPPSHDHIYPRSRGGTLAADNRAVVCFLCNRDKGSRSLGQWLNRLSAAGDPRADRVEAFLVEREGPLSFTPATPTADAVPRPTQSRDTRYRMAERPAGLKVEVSTNVVGEMIEVWIREDNRVLQL